MTEVLSNELSDLAERVKAADAASAFAARTSAEKAIEAGELLSQAKALVKHGEWLPFLARAGIGDRRARQYMQLSRSGLNRHAVADLGGVRAALEWLASWRLPRAGEVLIAAAADDVFVLAWRDHRGLWAGTINVSERDPHVLAGRRPIVNAEQEKAVIVSLVGERAGQGRIGIHPQADWQSIIDEMAA